MKPRKIGRRIEPIDLLSIFYNILYLQIVPLSKLLAIDHRSEFHLARGNEGRQQRYPDNKSGT